MAPAVDDPLPRRGCLTEQAKIAFGRERDRDVAAVSRLKVIRLEQTSSRRLRTNLAQLRPGQSVGGDFELRYQRPRRRVARGQQVGLLLQTIAAERGRGNEISCSNRTRAH